MGKGKDKGKGKGNGKGNGKGKGKGKGEIKNKGCWCGSGPHFVGTAGKWDCGGLGTGFQDCTWNDKPLNF